MGAFLDDQARYALARAKRIADETGSAEPTLEQRQADAARYAAEINARRDAEIAATMRCEDLADAEFAEDEPHEDVHELLVRWHLLSDAAVAVLTAAGRLRVRLLGVWR